MKRLFQWMLILLFATLVIQAPLEVSAAALPSVSVEAQPGEGPYDVSKPVLFFLRIRAGDRLFKEVKFTFSHQGLKLQGIFKHSSSVVFDRSGNTITVTGDKNGFSFVPLSFKYGIEPGEDGVSCFAVTNVLVTFVDKEVKPASMFLPSQSVALDLSLPHEHQYGVEQTLVAASCTEPGRAKRVCLGCGAEEFLDVAPTGHQEAWTLLTPATCMTQGEEVFSCQACDAGPSDRRATPMVEHSFEDSWMPMKSPSCTSDGLEERYCSFALHREERVVQASGHQLGEPEPLKDATCIEAGEEILRCMRCDYRELVPIAVLPHEALPWAEEVTPGCTSEGLEVECCKHCNIRMQERGTAALGHKLVHAGWQPDDCEAPDRMELLSCERCPFSTNVSAVAGKHEFVHDVKAPDCEHDGLEVIACSRCSVRQELVLPAFGHDYSEWLTSPIPTCAQTGIRERRCYTCERSFSEDLPTNNWHDFSGAWRITEFATCAAEGRMEKRCQHGCGLVYEEALSMLPHQVSVWKPGAGYSCEAGGFREGLCDGCGQPMKETIAPNQLHEWTEWDTVQEANCTEPGNEQRGCEACGRVETRPVFRLGHALGPLKLSLEPSCTERGEMVQLCSRCPYRYTEPLLPLGHQEDAGVEDEVTDCSLSRFKRFTCLREGCGAVRTLRMEGVNHAFQPWAETLAATCTEPGREGRQCVRCPAFESRELPRLGHHLGEQKLTREPSCSENGEMARYCARCDYVYLEGLSRIEHVFGAWETPTFASCKAAGERIRRCTLCNDDEKVTIAQLDHQYEHLRQIEAPSCAREGINEERCKLCEGVRQVALPRIDHAFDEWHRTAAPACGTAGQESRHCKRCPELESRELLPLHHEYSEPVVLNPAGCEHAGEQERRCKLCDERFPSALQPLGHRFGPWQKASYLDCEAGGEQVSACERCEATQTREAPPLAHFYAAWEVERPATCSLEGSRLRACRRCSHTQQEALPLIAHRHGSWVNQEGQDCAQGRKQTRVCLDCSGDEERQLPPKAHSYLPWSTVEASTCAVPGTRERKCRDCSAVEQQELAQNAHRYGDWAFEGEHSCDKPGEQRRSCTGCGKVEARAYEAGKHSYLPWQTISAASCEQAGLRERQCRHCAAAEQQELAAMGHSFGPWITVRKAACDLEGQQERQCKRCDHQEKRGLAALKHWLGSWRVGKAAGLDQPGQLVKLCRRCSMTLEQRSYSRPRESFAVSFCSFGIPLKQINSKSNRWYTLTPVDLRQEGEHRYPLIGNGTHCVGLVTVVVRNGELTVDYSLFAEGTELFKPSLRFMDSLEGLSDREIELRRVQRAFGKPINISRAFKERAVVFMSIRLQALFDASDARNLPYSLDSAPPEGLPPYRVQLEQMQALMNQFVEERK